MMRIMKFLGIKGKNLEENKQEIRSTTPNVTSNKNISKNIEEKKQDRGSSTPNINAKSGSYKTIEDKKQITRMTSSDITIINSDHKNIEVGKKGHQNGHSNFNSRIKGGQNTSQSKTPTKPKNGPASIRDSEVPIDSQSKLPNESRQNFFNRNLGTEPKESLRRIENWVHKNHPKNLINPCNLCKSKEGIYLTPQCTKHKYCNICIGTKIKRESSEFCVPCQNYLKIINTEVAQNTARCTTCVAWPNTSTWCKSHQYCPKCSEFFKINDFSHVEVVENCGDCKNYFKSNNKDLKKDQNILPKISPKSQKSLSPLKKFENPADHMSFIPSPTRIEENYRQLNDNLKSSVHSSNRIEEKYINYGDKPETFNYLKNQNNLNTNYRRIAESPKQIKSSNNIYNKREVISNNKDVHNRAQIRAKSTLKVIYNNKEINERVVEFLNLYRNKSPLIDRPGPIIAKPLEKQDSTALIKTYCDHCDSNNEIVGFLCNHNICEECLVFTCFTQIENFSKCYALEQGIAFINFSYRCPIEGCFGDISIPTQMALRKLLKFIKQGKERFICFKNYIEQDWSGWIPYFDGLDIFIPQAF